MQVSADQGGFSLTSARDLPLQRGDAALVPVNKAWLIGEQTHPHKPVWNWAAALRASRPRQLERCATRVSWAPLVVVLPDPVS